MGLNAAATQNSNPVFPLADFFTDLFGSEVVAKGGIRVASFPDLKDAKWFGFDLKPGAWIEPGWNNYFCVGELAPGTSRVVSNLLAHHLIVADDVGTKVDGDVLLAAMGAEPSFRVETSPGNQSWFWKIAGGPVAVGDAREPLVYAVRDYMKKNGLTDPGCADPVRYMRFAPGKNTKDDYVNPFDGSSPDVRVVSGVLGLDGVGLEVLCERFFGPEWETVVRSGEYLTMAELERSHSLGAAGSADWSDPLVRLASEIGLDPRAGSGVGKIDANCPNMAAHSQRIETGFAFLGRGLMKCHHGECAGLHVGDMRRLMCEEYESLASVGVALGTWPEDKPVTGEGFLAKCTFEGFGVLGGAGSGVGVGSGVGSDVSGEIERLSGVVGRMMQGDELDKLDERYCLVSDISAVVDRVPAGGNILGFIPFYTFRTFHDGRGKVAVPGRKGGVGLGSAWIDREKTPRFDRIGLWDERKEVVPPGVLNLFDGGLDRFVEWGRAGLAGAVGSGGALDLILGFIRDVICGGDLTPGVQGLANEWVLDWLAWGYQNPLAKPGTNLVLIGNQGTGKGTLGKMMLDLYGDFALHVTQSDHLLGRFSGHLEGKLFCFIDEAMFGKDPRVSGVYKARTTESDMLIEHKGQTPRRVKNHMKLLIASNHLDAAPVEPGDRRSTVLEVSDAWRGDKTKWGLFWDAWRVGGGREAFAKFLRDRDVSGFDPMTCFGTEAKENMADATGDVVASFWTEWLDAGNLFPVGVAPSGKDASGNEVYPDWNKDPIIVQARGVRVAFQEWLRSQKHNHRISPVEVHHVIGRLCPERIKLDHKRTVDTFQDRVYQFPPLERCRELAQKAKRG